MRYILQIALTRYWEQARRHGIRRATLEYLSEDSAWRDRLDSLEQEAAAATQAPPA